MTSAPSTLRRQQLQSLQSQFSSQPLTPQPRISFGQPALEPLWPSAGVPEGSLIELLSASPGVGAWSLALLLIRQLQQSQHTAILVDNFQEFFPPGASQLGIDLERLIVVQPKSLADQLWTIEQALRCEGRTVVISSLGRIPPNPYRRLKLAAERGGSLGLFLRPATLRAAPSWADLRCLVESAPSVSRSRRYKVTALTCLEGTASPSLLELCDESGALSVVPQLADPASTAQFVRAS